MKQSEQIIIATDVDGVLLDWRGDEEGRDGTKGFLGWMRYGCGIQVADDPAQDIMKRCGLEGTDAIIRAIKGFNNSSGMAELEPIFNAEENLRALHDEGFKFVAVTSVGRTENAVNSRIKNLQTVFGEDIFPEENIICVGITDSKLKELSKQAERGACIWVDDSPPHVRAGQEAGIKNSLLMNGHRNNGNKEGLRVVNNWDDIAAIAREEQQQRNGAVMQVITTHALSKKLRA